MYKNTIFCKKRTTLLKLIHITSLILLWGYSSFCYATSKTCAIKTVVQGISGLALNNVKAHFKESQTQIGDRMDYSHIRQWYEYSDQVIREALKPFGYFKPKIKSALHKKNNSYYAYYAVMPGPPLRITSLSIQLVGEGRTDKNLQHILKGVPLHCGQILTMEAYQRAKRFIYDSITSEGYLDSIWETSSIEINLKDYTSHIKLVIDTKSRYFIGPINFNSTTFSKQFLERYLPFKVGEPYQLNKVLDLQKNLYSTRYFQKVALQENYPKLSSQQIPLTISLTSAPKHNYTAGIGISLNSDFSINPRFKLGWLGRHLSPTGHQASIAMQISQDYKDFLSTYTIPGFKYAAIHQYYIQLAITQQRLKDIPTLTQQLKIASNFNQASGWSHSTFLNYQLEKAEDNANASYFLIPGFICNLKEKNWTNTNCQYKIDLCIRGALKLLFSDTNFLQIELKKAYLHTIANYQQFIVRTRVGYTTTSEVNKLPQAILFYAGGNNLRGYNTQHFGPSPHVLTISGEYRIPFQEQLYFTSFIDTGNTSDRFLMPLYVTGGIGLVWQLPIGTLEASAAKPFNEQGAWQYLFSFSSDFL